MRCGRTARHSGRLLIPALLLETLLVASHPANAAVGETATSAIPAAEPPALDQVVVTARHRAEKAQTVPIAVTTIDSKKLEAERVQSFGDLQQLVPTLQSVQLNPRNTSFNIRGLGSNAAFAVDGVESGVGVYVDGVYYSRPAQATFAFPDLNEVQVLRGPQGTLFGRNTTAGAIDVHTLQPSFKLTGDLEASVGNDGYWQLKGTVSGPVTDKVAVRLSALWDDDSGNVSNPITQARYNAVSDRALRAQVLIDASDDLTLRIIGDYEHQNASAPVALPNGVITTLTDGQPFPNGFLTRIARADYTVPTYDPRDRNTYDNISPFYTMETGGFSAQADYGLSYGTLTSISAWRFWNWKPTNDVDGTALSVVNAYSLADYERQASQEFRFTSPGGERLEYAAGLYYFYEGLPGTSTIGFGPDAGRFLLVPRLPLSLANLAMNGLTINGVSSTDTNSAAGYSQATVHVTPKLDVTGGLRLTYQTKQGSFGETQLGAASLASYGAIGTLLQTKVRNIFGEAYPDRVEHTYDTALSSTISVSYKLTPEAFLYASYSRGDKGSGINTVNLPSDIGAVVKPERVDAYEIGVKTAWLNNRLVVDGDLFLSEDHDYQGVNIAPLNSSLYATYIASVPQVRSQGFELDSHALLLPGVIVNFGGAYTDAINTKFPHGPCPPEVAGPNAEYCDLSGSQVAGISRWTMTAGSEYSHALGQVGALALAGYGDADYSLRSSFNTSSTNSEYTKIPGYGLLNLRLGIRTENRLYDFSIWAHNALNTYYNSALALASPISGLTLAIPGDPAMYGMTFRVHF